MIDDKSKDHFIAVDRYISGLLTPSDKILDATEKAIID
jgi:hypothetical protein